MIDYRLAEFDAPKAVQAGSDYVTKIYDQAAKLNAGKQYAAGDLQGAARTYAERGDIKGAAAIEETVQDRAKAAYEYMGKALPVFKAVAEKHAADPDKGAAAIARAFDQIAPEIKAVTGHPDEAIQAMRQSLMTDPQGAIIRAEAMIPPEFKTVGKSLFQIRGGEAKNVYTAPEDAPSGYQHLPDGKGLTYIPGGPGDPKVKLADAEARRDIIVNNPIPQQGGGGQDFKQGVTLRKEFDQLPDVKAFHDVANSYDIIADIARKPPTAQNDLSLIFSYMKMLDPGSVVREGEFANAQNTAGIPDQVRNAYNKAISGQRLNPQQRQEFTNTARGVYDSRKRRYSQLVDQYKGYARGYGLGDDVIQPRMEAGGGAPAVPKILKFNPATGKLE